MGIILLIISLLVVFGCSSQSTSSNTPTQPAKSSSTPTSITQPVTPTQPPESNNPQASTQTLKIGLVQWLGSNTGLEYIKAIELMADEDNNNGGLDIGGQKYQVQLIEYDSNNNQATEVAAVNRLIFEDKAQFIITSPVAINAWLPIVEANKVITLAWDPTLSTMDPKLHYNFDGSGQNAQWTALVGWFCNTYPDKVKGLVRALPDNQLGHLLSGAMGSMWKAFGVTPNDIFYPATQTDLSSLGTKVYSLNPPLFTALTGSDMGDGLVFNAVYQAGYRGQFFNQSQSPAQTLAQAITAPALEGFICGALPTEFDPPLTPAAKDFVDKWIAKYGKWEGPSILTSSQYIFLRTALIQAGTVDTDKVAAVMGGGLKYDTPCGSFQTISRPDRGNDRTVDSVSNYAVKQIHNGKPTLITTISMDDAIKYLRTANPPLPPGATPPGPPGPP